MSRTTRTILVIAIATVMATVATFAVYAAVSRIPVREVEVASLQVVVAVNRLPTGTRLAAKDLKMVAWPASSPLTGAFDKSRKWWTAAWSPDWSKTSRSPRASSRRSRRAPVCRRRFRQGCGRCRSRWTK